MSTATWRNCYSGVGGSVRGGSCVDTGRLGIQERQSPKIVSRDYSLLKCLYWQRAYHKLSGCSTPLDISLRGGALPLTSRCVTEKTGYCIIAAIVKCNHPLNYAQNPGPYLWRVTGSNPLRNCDEKHFDVTFSQCFPHFSSLVVQCRSVYANLWQLID